MRWAFFQKPYVARCKEGWGINDLSIRDRRKTDKKIVKRLKLEQKQRVMIGFVVLVLVLVVVIGSSSSGN